MAQNLKEKSHNNIHLPTFRENWNKTFGKTPIKIKSVAEVIKENPILGKIEKDTVSVLLKQHADDTQALGEEIIKNAELNIEIKRLESIIREIGVK